MTPHPARPAYPDGYRPTRTVAELMEETDAAARADEREQVAGALRSRAATVMDQDNPFAAIGADWLNLAADIAEGDA